MANRAVAPSMPRGSAVSQQKMQQPASHGSQTRTTEKALSMQRGSPTAIKFPGSSHFPSAKYATETLLPSVGELHPVSMFLRQHGAGPYAEIFIQNGFDELESLLEVEESDFQSMGVPSFVAARIMEGIRSERVAIYGPECAQVPQFDENNAVVVFLKDIGLPQYAEALFQSGFDEMETLFDVSEDDLKELGMPRGHVLKLRRRLAAYGDQNQELVVPQAQQQRCAIQQSRAQPLQQQGLSEVAMYGTHRFFVPALKLQSAVVTSWDAVQAIGTDLFAERLYKNFYGMVPEAMALFPERVILKYRDWKASAGSSEDALNEAAMRNLWGRVVNVVGCSVAGLHDTKELVPMLRQLGMRHINYGGAEQYWDHAGKALIITLQEFLGSALTQEVEQAWKTTFAFITAVMVSGLREAQDLANSVSTWSATSTAPSGIAPSRSPEACRKMSAERIKDPKAEAASIASVVTMEPAEEPHNDGITCMP